MKKKRIPHLRSITLFTCIVAVVMYADGAQARNFRVGMVPNGNVFSCNTCHTSGGGSARNPFGLAVQARVSPNGGQTFWDASLAAMDSDGDGFTNGEELRDPDGDGTPIDSVGVTNPGDASSKPADPNTAPGFTSNPVTSAFIGETYSYQATAFDSEDDTLTFSKVSGPNWLSVSSSGVVSGTPPDGSAGAPSVSLRVTDNGSPNLTGDQNYNLTIAASFTGFQNLNFDLPGEAAIAAADQDPDQDDIPNITEYALKTNPRSADAIAVPGSPSFDGSGRMQFVLQVRDDDPTLSIQLEASDIVPFSSPSIIDPVVTDPNDTDGLETWTFTDTISSGSISSRFGQLKFELAQ